jgi:hypothetical protein
MPIGVDLIDKDGPVLAAVANQVPLAVAVNVEPPHHVSALHGRFPNGGVDGLTSPRDVAWQADVNRNQAWHLLPPKQV